MKHIKILRSVTFVLAIFPVIIQVQACKIIDEATSSESAVNDKETRVFDVNDSNGDNFRIDQVSSEVGKLTPHGLDGANYQFVSCGRLCEGDSGYHRTLSQNGILARSPNLSKPGISRFRPTALVDLDVWNLGECSIRQISGHMPLVDLNTSNSSPAFSLSYNRVDCRDAPGSVTVRLLLDNGATVVDSVTFPISKEEDFKRSVEVGPRAAAIRSGKSHSIENEWIVGEMNQLSIEVILEGGHMGGSINSITLEAEYDYN